MNTAANLHRARVYRLLARLFRSPEPELLEAIRAEDVDELDGALRGLRASDELLERAAGVRDDLARADASDLIDEWNRNFEPSGGLSCSPNETTHTAKTPQEAWLKTYRLADVAGFYRAFGVEVEPGSEKPDHIGVELEFMHLLAVKAAAAGEREQEEEAKICQETAASFLADHLGLWCADVVSTLRNSGRADFYLRVAELLDAFVALDTETVGPPPVCPGAIPPDARLTTHR